MLNPMMVHTGMEGDVCETSTPLVYCPFPMSAADLLTPERAAAVYTESRKKGRKRASYLPLPWPMGDLIGTTWRNVHTGHLGKVVAMQRNRWGEPELRIECTYSWGRGVPWMLGQWSDERYVVEHWVRVDHLPVEDQAAWFPFRLCWLEAHITLDEQRLAECLSRGETVNRTHGRAALARDRREAAYAAMQFRLFAEHAGLPLPAVSGR